MLAPFLSVAVLMTAACGGSSTDSADTTTVATQASAAVDTVVETSAAPAPTEPATTEAAGESAFPGDGEWTAYYRITDNGGWYTSPDVAFTFPVKFECDDATCSTGTRTANPAGDPVPTPFTFDGEILSNKFDQMEACLNPTTGVADGPLLTATTAIDTMAPVMDGSDIIAFVGVRNFVAVTVGSADCTAEELGYKADVVYFRDDAGAPSALTGDGWFRAGTGDNTIERAIRLCTATPCDLQYRMPKQMLTADGSYQPVFVDVLLARAADGTYVGSANWVDSCASDNDNSFVAAEGYDTTLKVVLTAIELGDVTIIQASESQSGTPHASLTPEQAAVCSPYELEEAVHGIRMLDTAVEVTSWVEAPINP